MVPGILTNGHESWKTISPAGSGDNEGGLLANIESCIFPVLDDASKLASVRRSVQVPLQEAAEILPFCHRHGFSSSMLFQTMWALVLRCYVGRDSVSFGYLNLGRGVKVASEGSISTHDGQSTESYPQSDMLACSVRINDAETILQTIRSMKSSFRPFLRTKDVSQPFDTILIYQPLDLQRPQEDNESDCLKKSSSTAEHNLDEVRNVQHCASVKLPLNQLT